MKKHKTSLSPYQSRRWRKNWILDQKRLKISFPSLLKPGRDFRILLMHLILRPRCTGYQGFKSRPEAGRCGAPMSLISVPSLILGFMRMASFIFPHESQIYQHPSQIVCWNLVTVWVKKIDTEREKSVALSQMKLTEYVQSVSLERADLLPTKPSGILVCERPGGRFFPQGWAFGLNPKVMN